ncbi:EamA-like transporter family protein [Desulfocicer vacuolatum DSM 3385]|uniref:EamA-like transporter family protein n=1 Tax=Desulfocicer vacuolatum DSM 3385 TaxID=1121400 RepID=A0A1W2DJV9_9BACT|nr:DMT family transporter [Desulfocicer vacuolatum]SMC97754.1 EamA-like transporter family protein [Desulfocicer vacuolatum DSM 3385]
MKNWKPCLAGSLVVLIWSGWITISRYGVHTLLTPADITLLRYATALLVVSPFALKYPWKKFYLYQYLVVGLGVGFPYTMVSFYGLMEIKAAHAGILVNGMLPVFATLAAWFYFKQRISPVRYFAIFLIFGANLIMTGKGFFTPGHLFGIFLLLSAAVIYTFHMLGVRLWQFSWKDVLVVVPTVNCLFFLPLWFFFPSTGFKVPLDDILLQAIYQGVVVNVLALSCVAYAIRHLGTITVSLFMSFVPVITALFAWLLLGETLNTREITGILGCTAGLIIYNKG